MYSRVYMYTSAFVGRLIVSEREIRITIKDEQYTHAAAGPVGKNVSGSYNGIIGGNQLEHTHINTAITRRHFENRKK